LWADIVPGALIKLFSSLLMPLPLPWLACMRSFTICNALWELVPNHQEAIPFFFP
jgi:hypothetical protein